MKMSANHWSLDRHPLFERWQDPVSGVVSYILKERVAPLQQSFYFTNASVSPDEKWLWFYCSHPPNQTPTLGCVSLDPENPIIKHFPQSGFTSGSPMVAPESDGVYFTAGSGVYKLSLDGRVEVVCALSKEQIGRRQFSRIVTHLTMSADGKYFLLDGDLGNFWWVGIGDIQTGEVKIIKTFANHHDHAQFSPVDPNLFLISQDHWSDKTTGQRFPLNHRLWLMDIQQTRFEAVSTKNWYSHNSDCTHEWWAKDGTLCWVDYKRGAFEANPTTLETTHVWNRSVCHGHCSADRRYWCADENPYKWATEPVQILFYDRVEKKEKHIVTAMPQPKVPQNLYRLDPPYCSRDTNHLDPHPHFSPKGTWITYTTMVRGEVDVALCPCDPLK
jgi:hypothetical protein